MRFRAILIGSILVSTLSSCGDKKGNTVGDDPNVPVSLKKDSPTPEPTNNTNAGDAAQSNPPSLNNDNGTIPIDPIAVCKNLFGDFCSDGNNIPSAPQNPPTTTPPAPQMATLTIAINGLRNVSGNFCLSIFKSADGYPDSAEKAVLAKCFNIEKTSFEIKITDVAPGRYAVAGWHDENKDKELNKNWAGIPKEGLSFSENGKPIITVTKQGPPSFDSIAIDVGNEDRTTQMKTTYLL